MDFCGFASIAQISRISASRNSTNHALRHIRLAENEFSGPLLDRFNWTGLNNLASIELNDNSFSGTIPPSLEGLDAIRSIRLQNNLFTGAVPSNICNIRGLLTLFQLEADCAGDPVPNQCSCCSTCCDRDTGTCESVSQRRLMESDAVDPFPERKGMQSYHEFIPSHRKRLSFNRFACAAKYRWISETGVLEQVE